ncbi:hypothetical protein Ddye_006773 [Dipteronia dyeriana]|uniref:Reverse transcriptase domain-containing protein n=1 Tax=Dipteronia dyeriana TaxID=168575 RepID=A0AAD9XIP9_9ROSI|nr:hypothetical protein Ddye_006773 [Dipteronia dyeriana]
MKFFHISTIIRRRRNKIEGLKRKDGSWMEDIGELQTKVVRYFCNLFMATQCNGRLRGLLPELVSPNQVAFVPGWQIQDNIVIAREVLHKFKSVKGKSGLIVWKIYLAKAYDKLQWGFIKHVLEEVDIIGRMNNLIMRCITTVRFQMVVNGVLSESFSPNCGIR